MEFGKQTGFTGREVVIPYNDPSNLVQMLSPKTMPVENGEKIKIIG